jgi:SAM-dependent methyltransferase
MYSAIFTAHLRCLFYLSLPDLSIAESSPAKAGGFKPGTWKIKTHTCPRPVKTVIMWRMKYRESEMPDERNWRTFFEPEKILSALDAGGRILLDLGCGYGTFLIPAAAMVEKVIGVDIEKDMIRVCREKAGALHLGNVELIQGDISCVPYNTLVDYICLFNILHCENPRELLASARDLLTEKGKIGVIHWKREDTPRGPPMDIRPSPEDIILWAAGAGLKLLKRLDLPPYHFGLLFCRKENAA